MALQISRHRSGGGDSPQRHQVVVSQSGLQTKVVIVTKSGMNVLRLDPVPGKPGHFVGDIYQMKDSSPKELKPYAQVRAHFEHNYGTLQLTYRTLPEQGVPPSEVKLVGQAVANEKNVYNMLLLPK